MNDFLDLNEIFSCNYCNFTLDSPVILPCSETICQMHVKEMKKKCKKIKCFFCNKKHKIPKGGFPNDKRMAKLIARKFHEMDLGEAHKRAVSSCKQLEQMIDKVENLKKDPENFIDEYFNKIINEIDLFREESKLKIDRCHESCFNEIQMLKKDCLMSLNKELTTQNQDTEKFESYLAFWQQRLKIPNLSDNYYSFQNIKSNVDSSCLALTRSLEVFKNDLLLGKQYRLDFSKNISMVDLATIKIDKKVNSKLNKFRKIIFKN